VVHPSFPEVRDILTATDAGVLGWMSEGACLNEDPELFFPLGEGGANLEQTEEAISICHQCQVQSECLRFALVNCVKHGILGGRTEQERMAMIRSRRRGGPRRRPRRAPSGRPGK
jgi:WhiB family transcriptional regulator, redox-sensing transcriptional regulator